MATLWDVASRVGDEIMKALDDLIEESEDHLAVSPEAKASDGSPEASLVNTPSTSSPPRSVPRINLADVDHFRIHRFVDSRALQLGVLTLPSVETAEAVMAYYTQCESFAESVSEPPFEDSEEYFTHLLVLNLRPLFMKLNWIHDGNERVRRLIPGSTWLIPWATRLALPQQMAFGFTPVETVALRKWSVWIGHHLLTKGGLPFPIGLPEALAEVAQHPNHMSIGKCIAPAQWQLLLRGAGGTMDYVQLLMESKAPTSDANFAFGIHGSTSQCGLFLRTSSFDLVGAVLPQIPPKGETVDGLSAGQGVLAFFTFTPSFRSFVVDRTDSSTNFVISHTEAGALQVVAKCPQQVSADATADTENRDLDFGIAIDIEPSFDTARIATVGSANIPAPFSFNVSTADEQVNLQSVHVFGLAKKPRKPHGSEEDFVMVDGSGRAEASSPEKDSEDFVLV